MSQNPHLAPVVAFLREIGFDLEARERANGFLIHVRIENGRLLYNPEKATAANLLHEAGHLAVIPSAFRGQVTEDVDLTFREIAEHLSERFKDPNLDPDAPEIRAMLQCSETEATAWAFAAGRALGLPDDIIIEDEDYEGEGAEVRFSLSLNAYLGINGLVHGGMCKSVKSYPALTRWLQH